MDYNTHARKIIAALLKYPTWTTTPDWNVVDKPNTYHLRFFNEDVVIEYAIDPKVAPEIYAEGIGEGAIGPVYSESKSIKALEQEFEAEFLAGLTRRERRALKRKLKKEKKKSSKQ